MRTRRTRSRPLLLLALVAAALPPVSTDAAPRGFVARSGARLVVDGKPWRAIGVNQWDLNPSKVLGGDLTGCYYQHPDLDAYLDKTFEQIARRTKATVVRTFGFRSMYTSGGRDWAATDKLLYYAQKHDIRLIPVFGDQYATCGAGVKTPSWYRSGYRKTEQPWGISFRSYVVKAVRRYRSSPTIAMWQLMNEAASTDTTALASFSRDMVRAIRRDAGDTSHLINLGTATGVRPHFDRLLSCGSGGGCNDLGEAHVYNPPDGVPGAPLRSRIGAAIEFWNAKGDRNSLGHMSPSIEAWSPMKANPQSPGGGRSYTNWAIRLTGPSSGSWTAYLDDVRITTALAPQLYSFEAGVDGFTAKGATLTSSTKHAKAGARSLRAAVPAGTRSVTIVGPTLAAAPGTVELSIKLGFRAPAHAEGAGPAAMMHASVVRARKPFFLGELGFHAAIPGVSKCANHRTREERSRALDAFFAAHLDPERGSSGAIVWDWKDPSLQATLPDGRAVSDPTVDCWSVTPDDPATSVIASWADDTPNNLPAPRKAWSSRVTQTVLKGPPRIVAREASIPVVVRLTKGGDAMRGVDVRSSGCVGKGVTDALGHASFTCKTSGLGDLTVRVRPDPRDCSCDVVRTFAVTSKRAVTISAVSGFVERGRRAPITIAISEAGGSVRGVAWRVPACGLSGTVSTGGSSALITRTCATSSAWRYGKVLTASIPATKTTAPASALFAGIVFDRVYADPRTGECIGLTPATGWVGATKRAGACKGRAASLLDAFIFQVPAPSRARAFTAHGDSLLVAAEWRTGFRVDGRFEWTTPGRAFAGAITRSSTPAPASSADA